MSPTKGLEVWPLWLGQKGSPDKSFTCGIGLGYIAEEGEDVDFAEHPVLLLGGNIRLSESMALVSENWLITGEDLGLDQQPLGLVLRFFGPRIAVDAGVIIIGEVLKEGFSHPLASLSSITSTTEPRPKVSYTLRPATMPPSEANYDEN